MSVLTLEFREPSMACMGVGVEESLLFWVRIFFTDLKDHQAGVCVKAQTQASAASKLLWK